MKEDFSEVAAVGNPIEKFIRRRLNGEKVGIFSVCSANEFVIEAVLERAVESGTDAFIEATANQVNQFGGYTGMQPADFVRFVHGIARKVGLPTERIILGGDHLGPLVWQTEPEDLALEKAEELVRAYVAAGFQKIHIDTSMRLGSDNPNEKLTNERIAFRAGKLVKAAEEAYKTRARTQMPIWTKTPTQTLQAPVYVIGSEVPTPGGAQENDEAVTVTKADEFRKTYETFRERFAAEGLEAVFERVIAVVVQPGVEFSDASVTEYNRMAAAELCDALHTYPGIVFEGHSTDYQSRTALREMVEDGIAILKVGPALTYALRQALFALNDIEEAVLGSNGGGGSGNGRSAGSGCGIGSGQASSCGIKLSGFRDNLERAMLADDSQWRRHYHGSEREIALKRRYSFSDRCRYYLPEREVVNSVNRLITNIDEADIPMAVLDQYMPIQYIHLRENKVVSSARNLIKDRIKCCINDYLYAVGCIR